MQSANKLDLYYIVFENRNNNCWLDAAMILLAHNEAIKKMAKNVPNCKIHEIITIYHEAISILNDSDTNSELKIKTAREHLLRLQSDILEYLQPVLNFKNGEPESAFCALLNLIKSIKENLEITWLWKHKCTHCGNSKLTQVVKPIITLSKVRNFDPECPTSIYQCACKEEQEMELIYKELPECIFFHFENGAGKGKEPPLIFAIGERKYQLTGVITLEKSLDKSVSHFITWIRDPSTNKWLECNDLHLDIITFSEQPKLNLQKAYLYAFETFDNLGTIHNELSIDYIQEQDLENADVELIDLSSESEDVRNSTVCSPDQSGKTTEATVASLLKHISLDVSSQKAAKEENTKEEFESSVIRMIEKEHAQMLESKKTETVTKKSIEKEVTQKTSNYKNAPTEENQELPGTSIEALDLSVSTIRNEEGINYPLANNNVIRKIEKEHAQMLESKKTETVTKKSIEKEVSQKTSNYKNAPTEENQELPGTSIEAMDLSVSTIRNEEGSKYPIANNNAIKTIEKDVSQKTSNTIVCSSDHLSSQKAAKKETIGGLFQPSVIRMSGKEHTHMLKNEKKETVTKKSTRKEVSQKTSNYTNAPTEENKELPGTSIEGMDFTSCKASPINKQSKNKNPVSGKSSKKLSKEDERMFEEIVDSCVDSTFSAFMSAIFGSNQNGSQEAAKKKSETKLLGMPTSTRMSGKDHAQMSGSVKTGACHSASSSVKTKNPKQSNATLTKQLEINKNNPSDACSRKTHAKTELVTSNAAFSNELSYDNELSYPIGREDSSEESDFDEAFKAKIKNIKLRTSSSSAIRNEEGSNYLIANNNAIKTIVKDASQKASNTTVCSPDQSGKNSEASMVSLLKHDSLDVSSQKAAKEKKNKGSSVIRMSEKEHAQMLESEKEETVTKKSIEKVSGKSSKKAESENVDPILKDIVDSCVESTMATFFESVDQDCTSKR